MQPTGFDLTQWGFGLLAAGIGGFLGGTVGSYLKGYSTAKGEHLATFEDIQTLLGFEHGKAFEQEAGKRVATHNDIDNVLRELKLVTKEAETIKAQIGSDVWLRQTVWNQKRDTYVTIVKLSHAFNGALTNWASTTQVLKQDSQNKLPEDHILNLRNKSVDAFVSYTEAQRSFFNALVEAEIFFDASAIALVNEFRSSAQLKAMASPMDQDKWKEVENRLDSGWKLVYFLAKWTDKFVSFAKRDLGVPDVPIQ